MSRFPLPDEHNLNLYINESSSVRLLCTDADLDLLVMGFLYNEGLIQTPKDIQSLTIAADHTAAWVTVPGCTQVHPERLRPTGMGGQQLGRESPLPVFPVAKCCSLSYIRDCAKAMDAHAVRYAQTGGMHCSALFDGSRQLALFEDVGRHNTLDKLAGKCLRDDLFAEDVLLVTTGRISADMVRKAARLNSSVIASYTTPTQEAYELAAGSGITLIGYLKKDPTIYTFPERIR